ncbi:MAG: TolC family protein [Vicinamibacterales bacterium]
MRNSSILALLLAIAPAAASAQPEAPLRLTVDEAVEMALQNNVDLAAARIDPQIGDARVAAASGLFRPALASSVQRNDSLQAPTSLLVPQALRTDVVTSNVGVNQRLPWFGTTYNLGWDTSHTDTNNVITSLNPLLRSGVTFNVSQPLIRDFITDAFRTQLAQSRVNRSIADTRLRESIVQTTAGVKAAYWNLVSARANVDARRASLALAEELVRVNKAKVDVGQSPPIDLVSAQAEVASNQEQLIVAETAVKQSEDRLRLLIFDAARRDVWNIAIEPIDTPLVGTFALDLESAVTNALRDRTDLARARKDTENAAIALKLAGNQRLPDVRVNASYQANGLGGTQLLRSGGFPGTIVGVGEVTGFGSILSQVFRNAYPTWGVGVSVSYPVGQSAEQANHARSQLEARQAAQRVRAAEARVIQQVRDAAWKVEMNARRIETARAVRSLAEERRNVEQRRFDVGMSTSFLVIQAQRDLAQAIQNELAAVLAYDLSLVDFEALQQAGPAVQAGTQTTAQTATVTTTSSTAAAARPTTAGTSTTTTGTSSTGTF